MGFRFSYEFSLNFELNESIEGKASLCVKYCGVTVQMKATEQYFPVVLFIMLYKVVLTFESVDKILWCDVGVTT